jgi:hypothetical protein
MKDAPPTFPTSRPSGILDAKRGFSMEKFVALTVVLGTGLGIGVAVWSTMGDEEPTSTEGGSSTEGEIQDTTGGAEVTPSPPVEEASPKMDAGGPIRLDVPDPWSNDPAAVPSEAPGPDVEIPDWE